MGAMKYMINNAEEMEALGVVLLDELITARVVLLKGELGAGKTTFVQGLAKGLGIKRRVKSPTYTLVNIHPAQHPSIQQLVHVDLYRIANVDEQELIQIGLHELLADNKSLIMIEWPERLTTPVEGLTLEFTVDGDAHFVETKTAR